MAEEKLWLAAGQHNRKASKRPHSQILNALPQETWIQTHVVEYCVSKKDSPTHLGLVMLQRKNREFKITQGKIRGGGNYLGRLISPLQRWA